MPTLEELLNTPAAPAKATAPTQTLAEMLAVPVAPQAGGLRNQVVDEPASVGLRTVGGTLKDVGITAVKSVVGAGESAVGLADIPTFGMAGKALESVGYAPEKTHEILDAQYSPAQQQANKAVADASGFVGTVKAYAENPSAVGHTVLESAAPMLLGGGIASKFVKAGVGAATAGALGEGVISSGGMAESIRQQTDDGLLSPGQVGAAVGAGAGTALFGAVGARVAKKFGLGDVDEYLARIGTGVEGAAKQPKNILSRVVGGGISEGAFEELPQSVQETVWQNAALGKPLLEGVPESAAQGLVAGGMMGAGFNALPARSEAAQTKDHVATEMLKNAFPGAEVSVAGGKATIVRGEGGNTQTITADVADIGKMLAAGADLDEVAASQKSEAPVSMDDPDNALAFFEQSVPKEDREVMADVFDNIRQNNLHKGMTFPQQLFNMVGGVYESRTGKKLEILGGINEEAAPAPKFARLEDGPDTLRYNIRGKDYAYAPMEGQTVDDLRAGVEGKSPAAAVNWLKKNSQLVKETPNVQTDQVVPESVVPQAKEVIAPVARGDEVDASGVQGEPIPTAVQPQQTVTAEEGQVDAESLREDAGQIQGRGAVEERGAAEGGQDIQQPGGVAQGRGAQGEVVGQRPSKVKAEIEGKYGALDKVIASGKLNILRTADKMPDGVAPGTEIYSSDGKTVVGAYAGGKVYLVADAIAPGEAPGVFLHEVAHRLLDQDPVFSRAKTKIVADFGKLDTQAAKDARAKVPASTRSEAVGEEGLAYFLQTQEGRKSSLWRRLVVAVRSGLRRLGFDMKYTEDDILEMFTAGARSFVETGGIEGTPVTSPIMLSMREAAKAIFSKLERVSRASFQGMKAQGVANFLTKQGVKKAEMEAAGLNEWLATKKPTDKVTQAELVDFVKANTVELEDVVLGEEQDQGEREALNVERMSIVKRQREMAKADEDGPEFDALTKRKEEIDAILDKVYAAVTHFSQYTEPGAVEGSYREMFVTAPGTDAAAGGWYQTDPSTGKILNPRGWEDGHGQYSDVKNPVVRIRFNEVNADGKRLLRIEEMQGPNQDNQAKMPKHLRENIYQLGVKRILAYAKETGFDGVALATKPGMTAGETQADRYSLEKQISRIKYDEYDDHDLFRVWDKEENLVVNDKLWHDKMDDDARYKHVEAFAGKEIAKKIWDGSDDLTGLDLKVGGEGLKQLYDTTLPAMLEAYGKGKMESTQIGSVDTTIEPPRVSTYADGSASVEYDGEQTDFDTEVEATSFADSILKSTSDMPYLPLANAPASYPMFSLSEPKKVMSAANDALSESRKKVGEALLALANPRSKGRELYEKYAPQWLSVTSLHHVAQVFGKNVPQIKSMDHHMDIIVATKTALVDNSYDIALEAEKATKADGGAGIDAFDDAAFLGTFNRMIPWKDMFDQDWVPAEGPKAERLKVAEKAWSSDGMKKSTGLRFHEAYRESVIAYNKLSMAEQKHLRNMVADTAAIRQRDRTNMLKSIEELSEGNPELLASLMMQFNAAFNDLKGMYLPLSRFGDFILEFTDAEGFRTVEYFDTPADRKAFRTKVVSDGVSEATMVEKRQDKNASTGVGLPQELMVQLTKSVEARFLSEVDQADEAAVGLAREQAQSAVSDMNQAFFRWLPETSALKNSVRRKNIKGASRNMIRSYLDYVQRHAVSIAWTEVGRKIEQDIMSLANDNAEMRRAGLEGDGPVNLDMRTNLLNDMKSRVQAIRTVKDNKFWSTASKINTGMYMTSPSAFFVQMTQLPVLTLPKLGTMFGWGKSSKTLAKAGGEAFSKKFSAEAMRADQDVNAVYDAIHETVTEKNRKPGQTLGDLVLTEAQRDEKVKALSKMKNGEYKLKLLTLREALDRNLLDISAVHEARERAQGGDPNSKWSRLYRAAMLPMQHGELASRKTAVLATLDLSLKSGKGLFGKQNQDGTYTPGAIDDIHEVVKGTLFSYAKEDMGAATQGGAIRTILQFQKFRVFTGLRIMRLFLASIKTMPSAERAAARKEFVGIMGMSTLIGGVKGTVYAAPIMAIANLLFGWDDDEPYSAELDFANWMEETFGKTAGDAIAHGPITFMGINVSRRVGQGDIFGSQSEPPPGLHGAALHAWWASSLLGPTASVAQGWFKGYDQMMNKGNYMRGLEDASPKPLKDALKTFRFYTEGVKTGDGRKLLSDDEIGWDELITTFFGFQATKTSRAQAANRELGKISTAISERRGRLIRDAANSFVDEDGDIEGAIAAVTEHAQKMPRYAITASEIKGAIAKRIKGEFGVTGERELGVAQDYEIGVLGGSE